jgi:hypothetical protein
MAFSTVPTPLYPPVSSVGPLVIRGAVSIGLRVLSSACTSAAGSSKSPSSDS